MLTKLWAAHRNIIIAGMLAHLCAAIFSAGYFQVDEHFQILEFAALKLGIAGEQDLAWEYREQLRPAIQPTLAYGLIKLFQAFSAESPFAQAMALRMVSALLSLGCMFCLLRAFAGEIRADFLKKWLLFFSLLIWFLPYLHARFSSENWAGLAFWSGFALLHLPPPGSGIAARYDGKEFLGGVLLGFSFIIRFQAGILIAGLGLWLIFIKKERYANLLAMGLGILAAVFIGVLADYWFYEEWTFTAWNYFRANILQDKVSQFGIQPWWHYFKEIFLKGVPPFSIFLILCPLFVWIYLPRHSLTWTTLPFTLLHFFIGHKEMRFLFPLANIFPLMLILSLQAIREDARFQGLKNLAQRWRKLVLRSFLALNTVLLLMVCFKPADMQIPLYQYIYEHYDADATEVLYSERNPFSRAVPLNFYKKKELKVRKIENPEELARYLSNSGKTILFATQKFKSDPALAGLECQRVYQALPDFVKYLNLNNWMERTPLWTLYECRGTTAHGAESTDATVQTR